MEEEYETWLRDNMPKRLLAQLTANREYQATMRDQIIAALQAKVSEVEAARRADCDAYCAERDRAMEEAGQAYREMKRYQSLANPRQFRLSTTGIGWKIHFDDLTEIACDVRNGGSNVSLEHVEDVVLSIVGFGYADIAS